MCKLWISFTINGPWTWQLRNLTAVKTDARFYLTTDPRVTYHGEEWFRHGDGSVPKSAVPRQSRSTMAVSSSRALLIYGHTPVTLLCKSHALAMAS